MKLINVIFSSVALNSVIASLNVFKGDKLVKSLPLTDFTVAGDSLSVSSVTVPSLLDVKSLDILEEYLQLKKTISQRSEAFISSKNISEGKFKSRLDRYSCRAIASVFLLPGILETSLSNLLTMIASSQVECLILKSDLVPEKYRKKMESSFLEIDLNKIIERSIVPKRSFAEYDCDIHVAVEDNDGIKQLACFLKYFTKTESQVKEQRVSKALDFLYDLYYGTEESFEHEQQCADSVSSDKFYSASSDEYYSHFFCDLDNSMLVRSINRLFPVSKIDSCPNQCDIDNDSLLYLFQNRKLQDIDLVSGILILSEDFKECVEDLVDEEDWEMVELIIERSCDVARKWVLEKFEDTLIENDVQF